MCIYLCILHSDVDQIYVSTNQAPLYSICPPLANSPVPKSEGKMSNHPNKESIVKVPRCKKKALHFSKGA